MFIHHTRSPLLIVQEKLNTFNVGQVLGAFILPGILGIHLVGNQIERVAMFLHHVILQGGIHLAGNQIVRVAIFLDHERSPLLVVQEKLKTLNVGQAFWASILPGIWGIHLMSNQIVRVAIFWHHTRSPLPVVQEKLKTLPPPVVQEKLKTFNVGQAFWASILPGIWGIHLVSNQIVRVAIFWHHTRSPLPVVQEKLMTLPPPVVQEKLKTFNVGQAFWASILPGIWDIHLVSNQIVRVAMFWNHTRSPLPVVQEKLKTLPPPVVQEKLKTFNVGQAFETQPELHKFFTHAHFHLDKLLDELKINTLKEAQDKHQQDPSLDFGIENYVYPEKWHKIQADMTSNPNIMYTIGVNQHSIFYPYQCSVQNILKHLKNPKCVGVGQIQLNYTTKYYCKHHCNVSE